MCDSGAQPVHLTLQLKDGAYTRVIYDWTTGKNKLYAVDQQNGPRTENKVKAWRRRGQMVFCVNDGKQNYLLKVDKTKLMLELEVTHGTPDVINLGESYWFSMKLAANKQFTIQSKSVPTLYLISKEEERQRLFDLGDLETSAVFITQETISW